MAPMKESTSFVRFPEVLFEGEILIPYTWLSKLCCLIKGVGGSVIVTSVLCFLNVGRNNMNCGT